MYQNRVDTFNKILKISNHTNLTVTGNCHIAGLGENTSNN
jgi:hypothetical protein